MEGAIRTILLALEARIGRSIDCKERVISFMPEYAAYLANRFTVGEDGKTPYESMKGKKATVLGIEFGEKLLYKKKKWPKLEKMKSRWEKGIFVGIRKRSNEVVVATPGGIEEVRSLKRFPEEKRWGEDSLTWVTWAPWRKYRDAEDADGDLPEGVLVEERNKGEGPPGGVEIINKYKKENTSGILFRQKGY